MKEDIIKQINELETQREQAKEVFIKCIGAIEVLKGLLENNDDKKSKSKKDDSGT